MQIFGFWLSYAKWARLTATGGLISTWLVLVCFLGAVSAVDSGVYGDLGRGRYTVKKGCVVGSSLCEAVGREVRAIMGVTVGSFIFSTGPMFLRTRDNVPRAVFSPRKFNGVAWFELGAAIWAACPWLGMSAVAVIMAGRPPPTWGRT